ncbi:MAG: hypothetical protein QW555_01185 [Nitrososphaerota archaeon]
MVIRADAARHIDPAMSNLKDSSDFTSSVSGRRWVIVTDKMSRTPTRLTGEAKRGLIFSLLAALEALFDYPRQGAPHYHALRPPPGHHRYLAWRLDAEPHRCLRSLPHH